MTAVVMGFAILAALARGFVIGRIWQIRSEVTQLQFSDAIRRAHSVPTGRV